MKIEFKYFKHVDLVFHVLAHMHANNASNLFSQTYIDMVQEEKIESDFKLSNEVKGLEKYYNDNFERLMMINFLLFYSNNLVELKQILLNYKGFTEKDIQVFINPFIIVLEQESVFYYKYWENQFVMSSDKKMLIESKIESELYKYCCIFNYYNKSAIIYFSSSITQNGRGFINENNFSAIVPFPKKEDDFRNSFFTLLHEYTHQFTDEILNININMEDGSHDISENIVILFDYYLIKSVYKSDVKSYFYWLAKINGNDDIKISETEFMSIFKVSDKLNDKIKSLL